MTFSAKYLCRWALLALLALTGPHAWAQPANDLCSGALPISCGSTITGTTQGATWAGTSTGTCFWTSGQYPNVFYRFTAPATATYEVNTCGSTTGTGVGVMTGTCGNLSCVGWNANTGVCNGNGRFSWQATAGTTYYILVEAGSSTGPFRLQLLCSGNVCAPPNNVAVSGVTASAATVSFVPVTGGGNTFTIFLEDRILGTYTTRTVTGAAPVTLTGLYSGTDYRVSIQASPCANNGGASQSSASVDFTTAGSLPTTCDPPTNLVASNVDATSATLTFGRYARATGYQVTVQPAGGAAVVRPGTVMSPATVGGLLPGTTYTVSLKAQCPPSYQSSPVSVTFTTLPPPCDPPYGLQEFAVMPNSAEISFVPRSGALSTSLSWRPTAGGPAQTRPAVTSPFALAGLAPSTSYTVSLTSECAGGRQSAPQSITFTTPASSPPNDLCANAIELACGGLTYVMGTTVGAGRQGDPTGTCGGVAIYNSGGVFYKFTAPYDGQYGVGTCYGVNPTSFDSRVHVYAGTCGALTCVAANDNAPGCGNRSWVSVPATAGTTYYVLVTGGSNQPGPFQFSLYCPPPPPCPLPSALAVSATTDNSATLSFGSSAATGLGYTLTYQATGGAAQTRPVSSSPVVLTGLTPGSAYTWGVRTTCTGGTPSAVVGGPAFRTTGSHPSCPPPSNLWVNTFAGTTALLVFDPAPGVSTYTLTYQAAGGPVQTRTVSSSPTTLTGLTAGTAYTLALAGACANSTASAPATTTFTVPTSCGPPVALRVRNTTPTSATLLFELSGLATSYLIEYQASGGAWQMATTLNPGYRNAQYTIASLQPDTRYAVRVTSSCPGYTPATAAAATAFVTQPLCAAVLDAQATNVGPTTATLSAGTLVNPTGALPTPTFVVTYRVGTTGAVQTLSPNPAHLPVRLTGLLPGTTYQATIANACAPATTAATTTFTTTGPSTTPTNDLCADALILPCGGTIAGTTAGATTTGDPVGSACGGLAVAGPGVFYRFRAVNFAPRQLEVSTCGAGTQFDTRLHVFRGACGRLVCVGSNDNATGCGTASKVSFSAAPDSTYYVLVSGTGGATGAFSLGLSGCIQQAPCDVPTSPVISQLTPTSALLSFAPAFGATLHHVVYQAVGGPRLEFDVTGSPVQLSGLLPGTAYSITLSANCGLTYPRPLGFTTPAGPPCPAPPAVAVLARAGTTATVGFTPAGLPALGYELLAVPATGNPYLVTPRPGASPAVVTGLVAGATYTFALVSTCRFGQTSVAARTAGVLAARAAAAADGELLVYPNPSPDGRPTVQLASAGPGPATALLYNSLGQLAARQPLQHLAAGAPLAVRGLAAGLYTLRVEQAGRVWARKVVVE